MTFIELLSGCLRLSAILTWCFITQRSEELGLFVIDEDDNETLLVHRISTEEIYRKQEGIYVC